MLQGSTVYPSNNNQNPPYSSNDNNNNLYKILIIVGIVAVIIALCAHIPSMVTGSVMSHSLKIFVYGMYVAGGFSIATFVAIKIIIDTGFLLQAVNYFRQSSAQLSNAT